MDASSKQKISNQKGKSSIMRGINTAIICQVATRISNPGRATYEYEYFSNRKILYLHVESMLDFDSKIELLLGFQFTPNLIYIISRQ